LPNRLALVFNLAHPAGDAAVLKAGGSEVACGAAHASVDLPLRVNGAFVAEGVRLGGDLAPAGVEGVDFGACGIDESLLFRRPDIASLFVLSCRGALEFLLRLLELLGRAVKLFAEPPRPRQPKLNGLRDLFLSLANLFCGATGCFRDIGSGLRDGIANRSIKPVKEIAERLKLSACYLKATEVE
jgi:hypothetical protein